MIRVRPLTWHGSGRDRIAHTPFGAYEIRHCANGGYLLYAPGGSRTHYDVSDVSTVCQTAQEHFESAVRSLVSFEATEVLREMRDARPEGSESWTTKEFCRVRRPSGGDHVSHKVTPQNGVYGSLAPLDADFIILMCARAPDLLGPLLDGEAPDVRSAAGLLARCLRDPDWADTHVPGFRDIDFQAVYTAMTADHEENLRVCGAHDWPSTLIAGLEALYEGGGS